MGIKELRIKKGLIQEDRATIESIILSDVKGRMLEDIVLFETASIYPRGLVFKYRVLGQDKISYINVESYLCDLHKHLS